MYIFLTQCFPSSLGGIESLISNLAINIGKKNKVIVFADQKNILFDSIYDKKYQDIISVRRYGGIKYFRRRKKINDFKVFAENQNIKSVIADTWKSLELCIDYIKQKKITSFCLVHGNDLLSNNSKKKERIVSTLNKVDAIIANSNYTANLVNELLLNYDNIKVVYPGAVDLRDLETDSKLIIKGDPILLTLARLETRKGHEKVLQEVKKLKKDFPKIKYIIAGEGEEKNRLLKIVENYKIKENVDFIDRVDENQKKQLFSQAHLMVMPTLDESSHQSIEGFGISYIEASFFGIPSIASNVGGTPEAVLNNTTGTVINNHDELYGAIYDLLYNKEKLKKLGIAAQQRAEKSFRWEKVAENYLMIFNNLP